MTQFETHAELAALLESLFEGTLAGEGAARIQEIIAGSPAALAFYVSYTDLHGTLYWDAGGRVRPGDLQAAVFKTADLQAADLQAGELASGELATVAGSSSGGSLSEVPSSLEMHKGRRGSRIAVPKVAVSLLASLAALLVIGVGSWLSWSPGDATRSPDQGALAVNESPRNPDPTLSNPAEPAEHAAVLAEATPVPRRSTPRIPIDLGPATPSQTELVPTEMAVVAEPPGDTGGGANPTVGPVDSGSRLLASVERINSELRTGWRMAGISASPRADDAEWLRRVYLDLSGRIPSVDEAEVFLADGSSDKRNRVVEHLLSEPAYARHMTTVFSNLLVGRDPAPQVDRRSFAKYLRMSFAANRPWNDLVSELVSARGRTDENGATNFLVAHLNNQAVPATAITARVFLGVQLQCTQCHNHPFNDSRQVGFWEFNSFFQQTAVEAFRQTNPQQVENSPVVELVSRPIGGAIYYETQSGLLKAALPRFDGQEVSLDPEVDRRQELARLMTTGAQPQLAAAFVNRMWQHFFGVGFTPDVGDMGSHNPASHPELLAGLSEDFMASGYDIRFLIRSICLSEAYQLTSRLTDLNDQDVPEQGEVPLFSRVYSRPMSSEQLYDSLLVATDAHVVDAADWDAAMERRQSWLEQFVVAMNTEENDEANTFEGTVTQALAMMNGELMTAALQPQSATLLGRTLRDFPQEADRIRRLCLATLGRPPSSKELVAMRRLVRSTSARNAQGGGVAGNPAEGYQDLLWALLNSNEFSVVH